MTGFLPNFVVSSASTEYVQVPISLSDDGSPTSDAVSMAFPITGVEPTHFYSGVWTTLDGVYFANCLIGPASAAVLPIGYYDVYVKITDSPEVPVIHSGLLEVT